MVIRTDKRTVYCIGVDGQGMLETNDEEFVNLGSVTCGPRENIKFFKKINISYEPGSYFDYIHRVIIDKEFDILTRLSTKSDYINFIQIKNNIKIDPTKNTHEEYYKPFFGKYNGLWL